MSWQQTLPLLIVLSALLPGIGIFFVPEHRQRLRTLINLGGAFSCVGLIVVLVVGVYHGLTFETRLPLLPSISLVLHADALSLLFVSLSAVLWLLTTLYAVGYLQNSAHRSRFFGFFSLCVCATTGIALAGNLITFLIFYELLTLTTYPLVMHRGNAASLRAGRIYLAYTLIGGALLLAGVAWLKSLAGPLDFTATGILSELSHLNTEHLQIIFFLLLAGLGVKAALFPLHGWLPVAMAAPAPVSALLHAVAVVKAGAFGIVRVVYDVYGIEFARDLGLTFVLGILAALTIVYGSVRALFQNDLKRRLAFSTVSQVSYIALGTAVAGPIATIGGLVHLVHQGLMKITLFFCAGNFAETLGIHKVNELNGAGRRMPWTMTAFTLAALGMIGVPPLAGFVSKWYLGVGALEVGAYWVMAVIAISSLLNAAYFLPLLYRAWFKPAPACWPAENIVERLETRGLLLWPPVITAALALAVGVFAGAISSPLSWTKLIAAREYGATLTAVQSSVLLPAPSLLWSVAIPLLLAAMLWLLRRSLSSRSIVAWLPCAALPALIGALFEQPGSVNQIPYVFFGSVMSLDDVGQVFLLLAGLLWLGTAIYAQDYLQKDHRQLRFAVCFLVCMAGNFGLILAQDLFGFITFFTMMSLAAYGLVIHTTSHQARQAAKSYIQWAVLGEVLLFTAFAGLALANSLNIIEQAEWITYLLLLGFGIKVGVFGLHVWLPRAHPVAPTPASALLSGIMVKAGVLGWLRFLPLGESSLATAGYALMGLGLSGAFIAVLLGIVQHNSKSVLAYSTVSQMGIITTAVGAGLLMPALWPLLLPALVLYVVHHGLCKAALFLSVGLTPHLANSSTSKPYRMGLWVIVCVPALVLMGLPLSGGAMAKTALKTALTELPLVTTLISLTAIGTTVLMLRFLQIVYLSTERANQQNLTSTMLGLRSIAVCTVLTLLTIGAVYFMPQAGAFLPELNAASLFSSNAWPILIGLLIYWAVHPWLKTQHPLPTDNKRTGMLAVMAS